MSRDPTVESDLRNAIESRAIDVFVQPQLHTINRDLAGAEALARWVHTQRGIVGPDEFIPTAERCGLIDALTALVLDRALEACAGWRQAGVHCRVAVNGSIASLEGALLPEQIGAALGRHGLNTSHLMVEVSASSLLREPARAAGAMSRLRTAGIPLSVDDFGVVSSGQLDLRRFPVDELKIDRGFVGAAGSGQEAQDLLETVVQTAHGLGMKVAAVGVESMGQLDMLRRLGCDLLQGYLVSRPFRREELPKWERGRR